MKQCEIELKLRGKPTSFILSINSMNVIEKVVPKIDMKTEHAEKSVMLPAQLR